MRYPPTMAESSSNTSKEDLDLDLESLARDLDLFDLQYLLPRVMKTKI